MTSNDRILISDNLQVYYSSHSDNLQPIRIEGVSPVWSPDGTKVAYLKCDPTETCILNVADFDGKNPRPLTEPIKLNDFPSFENCWFNWSLDSKQIVYAESFSNEIMIVSVDTQNRTAIVPSQPNVHNFCPIWLQNGYIGFLSDRDEINKSFYDFRIYSIALDGSDLRQISDDTQVETIAASPDGSRIAFRSVSKSGEISHPVYVMNYDGSEPKLLGKTSGLIMIWAPNGQYLTLYDPLKITVIESTSGALVWEYQVSPIDYLKVDTPKYPVLPALLCGVAPLTVVSLRIAWLVHRRKERRNKPAKTSIPPSSPALPSA